MLGLLQLLLFGNFDYLVLDNVFHSFKLGVTELVLLVNLVRVLVDAHYIAFEQHGLASLGPNLLNLLADVVDHVLRLDGLCLSHDHGFEQRQGDVLNKLLDICQFHEAGILVPHVPTQHLLF